MTFNNKNAYFIVFYALYYISINYTISMTLYVDVKNNYRNTKPHRHRPMGFILFSMLHLPLLIAAQG